MTAPPDSQKMAEGSDAIVDAHLGAAKAKAGPATDDAESKDWLHKNTSLTLANVTGNAVLVDFWAKRCGACVIGIMHRNKWHEEYAPNGLVIRVFTGQNKTGIENDMTDNPMELRRRDRKGTGF